MSVLRQRIEEFVASLIAEETYDEDEEIWVFADGRACAVCTSSARRIAREFGGDVFGYLSKMNPAAEIGAARSVAATTSRSSQAVGSWTTGLFT